MGELGVMRDDDKSVRDGAIGNVAEGSGEGCNGGVVVAPALSFSNAQIMNGEINRQWDIPATEGGLGTCQNNQCQKQQDMMKKMSRQGLNEIGRTGFGVMNRVPKGVIQIGRP